MVEEKVNRYKSNEEGVLRTPSFFFINFDFQLNESIIWDNPGNIVFSQSIVFRVIEGFFELSCPKWF